MPGSSNTCGRSPGPFRHAWARQTPVRRCVLPERIRVEHPGAICVRNRYERAQANEAHWYARAHNCYGDKKFCAMRPRERVTIINYHLAHSTDDNTNDADFKPYNNASENHPLQCPGTHGKWKTKWQNDKTTRQRNIKRSCDIYTNDHKDWRTPL